MAKQKSEKKAGKKEKNFSELLSESWKDYKKNFKLIFLITIIFSLIPSLIVFYFSLDYTGVVSQIAANKGNGLAVLQIFLENPGYIQFLFFSTLFLIVISFIMYFILIYISLYGQGDLKLGNSIKNSFKYFLGYLLLNIVVFFALLGLFLLLIIPAIIFFIFWIFSPFVLINENTKIIESMKRSKQIVRKRWWFVFGYVLLFFVVLILISFVVLAIFGILSLLFKNFFAINNAINIISGYIQALIFIFAIFFLKNFYISLKENPVRK